MHTIYCQDRRTAIRAFPGAARIVKVCGGFVAFDTLDAYLKWRAQR